MESQLCRVIASIKCLAVLLPQFTRAVVGVVQVRTADLPLSFAKMSELLDISATTIWRAAGWLQATISTDSFSALALKETDVVEYAEVPLNPPEHGASEMKGETDFEGEFPTVRIAVRGDLQNEIIWKWHLVNDNDFESDQYETSEALRLNHTKEHGRPRLLTIDELRQHYKDKPAALNIVTYLENHGAVVSGTRNFRVVPEATFEAVHPRYVAYCQSKSAKPLKRTQFEHYLKRFGVHPSEWTKYLCCYCQDQVRWERTRPANAITPPRLAQHQLLITSQHDGYEAFLDLVSKDPNCGLAVVDYTKIHELGGKLVPVNDVDYTLDASNPHPISKAVKEVRKLNDLIWVLLTQAPGEDLKCENFDFFSFSRQLPCFFNASALKMQNELCSRHISTLYAWTDGGMRNYANLAVWGRICFDGDRTVVLICSAPGHGHGRADAHAGSGKARLRRQYNGKNGVMLDSATHVVQVFNQLDHTKAALLPTALPPVQEDWPHWTPGIRSYYAFCITKHRTLAMHVMLECWEDFKDMQNKVRPRIINLDLSSLYNQRVNISLLGVSQVVEELPKDAQFEVIDLEAEPASTARSFSSSLAVAPPLKYSCLGESPFAKSNQGIPKHELINNVRHGILNAYTMSGIPKRASDMLCNAALVDSISKVCHNSQVTTADRRAQVRVLLQDLLLADVYLQ